VFLCDADRHVVLTAMSGASLKKVAPRGNRPSIAVFRGSTVSYHNLSYFVDVPVPDKRCVRERKQILKGVR